MSDVKGKVEDKMEAKVVAEVEAKAKDEESGLAYSKRRSPRRCTLSKKVITVLVKGPFPVKFIIPTITKS